MVVMVEEEGQKKLVTVVEEELKRVMVKVGEKRWVGGGRRRMIRTR